MKFPFHKMGIEVDCPVGRGFVDAPYDAVVMHQFVDYIAWEHAFGAVGDIYFSLQFGTQFENEFRHCFRSPDRRCGLDDI